MEIENDGVDGEAIALISRIRRLSVYSIIYGAILIPILLIWGGSYSFPVIAWVLYGVIILAGLWTYLIPSKANLLFLGITHSLAAAYGGWSGMYVLGASVIFALMYFIRFSCICKTPVTIDDLKHIKALDRQFKPQKPGNVIRITVITLVDRRIWRCILGEEKLLIHNRYRDEMHVGSREDVRILGSNCKKPRINVRFTLRMNGDIYRCKTNRFSFYKLDRWIEDGRWGMAN